MLNFFETTETPAERTLPLPLSQMLAEVAKSQRVLIEHALSLGPELSAEMRLAISDASDKALNLVRYLLIPH